MLSICNHDLIQQSFSDDAVYRREYRPTPQNEQYILDVVSFLLMITDTYLISTLLALVYFPENVNTVQNATLLIVFALYGGRLFGEFLFHLNQHREFVNTQKQFTIPSWEDPNIKYICQLVWHDSENMFDFRTHVVRVGVLSYRCPQQQPQPSPPPVLTHSYNTRSKVRRSGHA